MARKGSGLRVAIKVVKAIDRANKQATRDAAKRQKQNEREEVRRIREHEKMLKEVAREDKAREKAELLAEKKYFKYNLGRAQKAYELRCSDREALRNKYIDGVLSEKTYLG
jgi:hypothetical protein